MYFVIRFILLSDRSQYIKNTFLCRKIEPTSQFNIIIRLVFTSLQKSISALRGYSKCKFLIVVFGVIVIGKFRMDSSYQGGVSFEDRDNNFQRLSQTIASNIKKISQNGLYFYCFNFIKFYLCYYLQFHSFYCLYILFYQVSLVCLREVYIVQVLSFNDRS